MNTEILGVQREGSTVMEPAKKKNPTPVEVDRTIKEILPRFLHDRNALCPWCHFNLRGLSGPDCPKCGQPLSLSLSVTNPIQSAWIALVVATCLGAPIGMVRLISYINDGFNFAANIETYASVGFVALFVLAMLTLALRRYIIRLPRTFQWSTAAVGFVLLFASFGSLFYGLWTGVIT